MDRDDLKDLLAHMESERGLLLSHTETALAVDLALAALAKQRELDAGVHFWAAFSDERDGWCVWRKRAGSLMGDMIAGPFKTRDQAEALLGPAAPQGLPDPHS